MPQIHKERQDLGRLVREMVLLYQEAHKHLTLSWSIEPTLPEFLFDAVQIKRVLINLLDNAVSVLGKGGAINVTLGTVQDGRMVRLEVADNGPGMSDEVKLRIFEPYFSTRTTGTGLGLAITQTIVHEHGGIIRVTDNHPAGAVFAVELPLQT
jgi:two-component system nitrogen regulation sensor histidine kinase NtrY